MREFNDEATSIKYKTKKYYQGFSYNERLRIHMKIINDILYNLIVLIAYPVIFVIGYIRLYYYRNLDKYTIKKIQRDHDNSING